MNLTKTFDLNPDLVGILEHLSEKLQVTNEDIIKFAIENYFLKENERELNTSIRIFLRLQTQDIEVTNQLGTSIKTNKLADTLNLILEH